MEITQNLLTKNPYSRPGITLKKVTKIAVHYVGNAGSSAIANRNYFETLKDKKLYASSHYIIGLRGEIIQCVPEAEMAYATYSANNYSISIENCHPGDDGKFNSATRASLVELCADICKRYNLNPLTDIIRHYDVSKDNGYRKPCPLYWVNHPDDFGAFKKEVAEYMKQDLELIGALQKINKALAYKKCDLLDIAAWENVDTMNVKWVEALILRLGNLFGKKDYKSTIDFLVEKKVILDRILWDKKEFVSKYVRIILIRVASLL